MITVDLKFVSQGLCQVFSGKQAIENCDEKCCGSKYPEICSDRTCCDRRVLTYVAVQYLSYLENVLGFGLNPICLVFGLVSSEGTHSSLNKATKKPLAIAGCSSLFAYSGELLMKVESVARA